MIAVGIDNVEIGHAMVAILRTVEQPGMRSEVLHRSFRNVSCQANKTAKVRRQGKMIMRNRGLALAVLFAVAGAGRAAAK